MEPPASPAPAVGAASPEETYRRREAAFEIERAQLAAVSFRYSLLRGALFLGFAGCLLTILIQSGRGAPAWGWSAGLLLLAFLAALPFHDKVIRRERRADEAVRINREALARLERQWDGMPLPALSPAEPPPLARDLNLFGRASLAHLLGTVHSPPGRPILVRWLLEPATAAEIPERQQAVRDLAGDLEFRQHLELRTRLLAKGTPDCEPFLAWAEGEPWLLRRPALVWISRLLAAGTLALGLAAMFTSLPASFFFMAIPVNLAFSFFTGKPMDQAFHRASAREREFQLYGEAMALAAAKVPTTPSLAPFARDLAAAGLPAPRAMEQLDQRVSLADVRHSSLLHAPLQLILLWDFHALYLLERWQVEHGRLARGWLEALGRLEALSAFAGLAFDNPDWAFPKVGAAEERIAAVELGHPLLAPGARVANDVEIGPAGSFLLVTGSNMSGKSTLLRAVGINAVLAQAGAPVCAASLSLPPVTLATSILIEDSLADGVSFFMAELLRIQQIVRAADRAAREGKIVLYLLDEILRGTNSEERQVAVRRVVLHLLHCGALGAVSTHDLRLADLPDLAESCRAVHFQEQLHPGADPAEGSVMTFDYRMRPGVATTTNALKLLELLGLDLPS
jgi:hypothetical protein